MNERLSRFEPLATREGLKRLANSTVMVIGCGGVGGNAIEALARAGVGTLIIVDKDVVEESNINRQVVATYETIGKVKVDVMEARIKSINPDCKVIKYQSWYNLETRDMFWAHEIDAVYDAIDTVTFKLDIIKHCLFNKIPFITCVGQGNRMAPEKITIKDLMKTSYDPMSRNMRQAIRKQRINGKIPVVCSEEIPLTPEGCYMVGSTAFGPSVAGLVGASYLVRRLIKGD